MNKISQGLLLLVVMWHSAFTYAVEPLSQHALAVSQSMSAFYMVSLTEGDKRYIREFEEYANVAESYLKQYQTVNSVKAAELANQWFELRPHLKHEYVEGTGLFIDNTTRYQFRSYLSSVYEQLIQQTTGEMADADRLTNMAVQVEVMSARFFDVASALQGTLSIRSEDIGIDPKKMARTVNENLELLQGNQQISKNVQRDLRSINTKWKFIEETLTNYNGEAAVFLVYFNKKQITKLLVKSQETIAQA